MRLSPSTASWALCFDGGCISQCSYERTLGWLARRTNREPALAFENDPPSALSHFEPRDLLDALSSGVVVLDAQLCVIYANSAAQDALAFRVNQARGRPFGDFLGKSSGLISRLRRALETGECIADHEHPVRPLGSPRNATRTTCSRNLTGSLVVIRSPGCRYRANLTSSTRCGRCRSPSALQVNA